MGKSRLVFAIVTGQITCEQKHSWVTIPSALWDHPCDWQASPTGMSKSGNEGRMAKEGVVPCGRTHGSHRACGFPLLTLL